jgi:hypothetical protein
MRQREFIALLGSTTLVGPRAIWLLLRPDKFVMSFVPTVGFSSIVQSRKR